jgi:prepilin-type N-terminal cleavage/methylation domain-containing protein
MKNFRLPISDCRLPGEPPGCADDFCPIVNRQSSIGNALGFTLIELLVVISIIGLLAGLSVPVLKNLGKDNAQISAVRQILDDVARARQLAISRHTTVYMVFVTTNFFDMRSPNGTTLMGDLGNPANYPNFPAASAFADRDEALITATNLVADQLSGYGFLALRSVGDQPGQGVPQYIGEWKSLPDGTYIAPEKFYWYGAYMQIPQWQSQYARPAITNFARVQVPFLTGKIKSQIWSDPARYYSFSMPCLMFDYQGRLVNEDGSLVSGGADIPLVQGRVSYGMDVNKQPAFTTVNAADISETPPGNSGIGNNNFSYQVIHIDALTGRASLEQYKMP